MIRPVFTPEEAKAAVLALDLVRTEAVLAGLRFVGADLRDFRGAQAAIEAARDGRVETAEFEALGVPARERRVWDPREAA